MKVALATLIIVASLALAAWIVTEGRAAGNGPPVSFLEQALCVHSGWHYTAVKQHGDPDYVLWNHGYWRTWKTYANGEGGWTSIGYVNGSALYGGGMQFMLSTWINAGGRASSLWDITKTSAKEQLWRAWTVVSRDGGWSEWGTAARACGL